MIEIERKLKNYLPIFSPLGLVYYIDAFNGTGNINMFIRPLILLLFLKVTFTIEVNLLRLFELVKNENKVGAIIYCLICPAIFIAIVSLKYNIYYLIGILLFGTFFMASVMISLNKQKKLIE